MAHPLPITVAICTRNRAGVLRTCLESLVTELGADNSVPVIVVDNGSTDDTSRVAAEFRDRLNLQFIEEPQVGLSRARNRALDRCASPYIVFLDDDAIVDPGWATAIDHGIAEWQPGAFGGPYRPYYLGTKPPWFLDDYASKHLEKARGPLDSNEVLSGGNMGWRSDVLRRLGGFSPDLGMHGHRLGIGEETAVQYRIVEEQPDTLRIFLPGMSIRHLVSPEKLRCSYWLRRAWITGWLHDTVRGRRERLPWWAAPRLLAGLAVLVVALPLRDRRCYPYWQTYVLERVEPKLKMLAIIASRLRHRRIIASGHEDRAGTSADT